MSMNAFAAGWQQGSNGWWYATNEDNSQWYSDGWQWIDSNGDGSAECYYFDSQGWLLTNTTAPDGSQVNENGAWVVNGVVQAKAAASVAAISESDFVIGGDNPVTQNTADHSVISNWKRLGYISGLTSFVTGDSLVTARGITLGSSRSDVTAQYGSGNKENFNSASDFWYQQLVAQGGADASVIGTAASVEEYQTVPYGIRFYYNAQDQVIGIIFFEDAENTAITPREGTYRYFETAIYKVEADNSLTLGGKTSPKEDYDAQHEEYRNVVGINGSADHEWMAEGLSLTNISETTCILSVGGYRNHKFMLDNGFWYEDMDQNGVLSAEEKDVTPLVMKNGDTIEHWWYRTVQEYETIAANPENTEYYSLEAKYGWGLGTLHVIVDTYKLQ